MWSQNSKIPIFLEFCQKFSGNLEIPRCWLIWTNLDVLGIISTQFLSLTSILNSEIPDTKLSGIYTQNVKIGLNQPISGNFQISRKFLAKFQKNRNFGSLTSQSCSVTYTEWEIYPKCQNWAKPANFWEFPDFPISNFQIPENSRFHQKCAIFLWICYINHFCKYLAKNHPFW